VLEGFRRVDEWRLMEGTINFDQLVIVDQVALDSVGSGNLTRTEQMVLGAVTGSRTVSEILKVPVGLFDAIKIIYQFLQSWCCGAARPGRARTAIPAVLAVRDTGSSTRQAARRPKVCTASQRPGPRRAQMSTARGGVLLRVGRARFIRTRSRGAWRALGEDAGLGWGAGLGHRARRWRGGDGASLPASTRAAARPAPRRRWQPGDDWPVPGGTMILCDPVAPRWR
jgi:hypothetical protein